MQCTSICFTEHSECRYRKIQERRNENKTPKSECRQTSDNRKENQKFIHTAFPLTQRSIDKVQNHQFYNIIDKKCQHCPGVNCNNHSIEYVTVEILIQCNRDPHQSCTENGDNRRNGGHKAK